MRLLYAITDVTNGSVRSVCSALSELQHVAQSHIHQKRQIDLCKGVSAGECRGWRVFCMYSITRCYMLDAENIWRNYWRVKCAVQWRQRRRRIFHRFGGSISGAVAVSPWTLVDRSFTLWLRFFIFTLRLFSASRPLLSVWTLCCSFSWASRPDCSTTSANPYFCKVFIPLFITYETWESAILLWRSLWFFLIVGPRRMRGYRSTATRMTASNILGRISGAGTAKVSWILFPALRLIVRVL